MELNFFFLFFIRIINPYNPIKFALISTTAVPDIIIKGNNNIIAPIDLLKYSNRFKSFFCAVNRFIQFEVGKYNFKVNT